MLDTACRPVERDGLFNQIGADRDGGNIHGYARRVIGECDRIGKHLTQGLNDAQIDAVTMCRITRWTLMNDDVLISFRSDDVDRRLNLAEVRISGINLKGHAS